jgi:hypothetical protein
MQLPLLPVALTAEALRAHALRLQRASVQLNAVYATLNGLMAAATQYKVWANNATYIH